MSILIRERINLSINRNPATPQLGLLNIPSNTRAHTHTHASKPGHTHRHTDTQTHRHTDTQTSRVLGSVRYGELMPLPRTAMSVQHPVWPPLKVFRVRHTHALSAYK